MLDLKKCPLCTKNIDSSNITCPYCGYEFERPQPEKTNPYFNNSSNYPRTVQKSKPSRRFIDVGLIVVVVLSILGAILTEIGEIASETFIVVFFGLLFAFCLYFIVFFIIYWIIGKVYPNSCGWGVLKWIFGIFGVVILLAIVVAFIFGFLGSASNVSPESISPPIPVTTKNYVTEATFYKTIDPYATPTRYPTLLSTEVIIQRQRTGTIISGHDMYGGKGELKIDNLQGASDVVAILTKSGTKDPLSSVYIRSGEIHTYYSIPDGNYDLYILYGENWNINRKKFEDNIRYVKFEDTFPFTTKKTTTTDEIITDYTTWRVTLYNVIAGNADTETLSEENFPKI
jgi:hypothetical protein